MSLEDKIGALPDDILLTILSLLTFKEAVATSILSQRWRYLWTCLPSLNFRYEEVAPHNDDEGSSKGDIDLWVAFAIAIGSYSLPLDLFDKTKGLEPYLVQLDCVFSIPTSSLNVQNRFKSLRELRLKFGDVTDEQFDTNLSSCISLECLHLLESSRLVNVKHSLPHMKLNYLEIYNCSDLENIEIFAPNLVSFKYRGPRIYIFVKDAKQLVNVVCTCLNFGVDEYPAKNTLGLPYTQGKHFVFGQFGDYLSQLEYLMMDVGSFEGIRGSNKVPLLCNLKHPTLSCLNASRGPFGMLRCYQLVASLAKASPFLHRLKLRFSLYSTENSPHKYLKEVLVSGFSGNKLSTDFVMSIFDFVIELEKIEITSVYLGDVANSLVKQGKADVVRKSIGLLHQRLPAKAQLYFLDDQFFIKSGSYVDTCLSRAF
ncbi:F-box/FBD/LRR-repeat protein At1g13570 [Gossypium hirsutum]|uniref:F-box/FBD/LRR-repeat protein At1g13570 n=1 Tax=Gossypium hirsutum TaxID=3635 RepID=A0A1U8IH04_GOSHI|nr:F-box/FBD/LRR-repeat protein At1g13570-like [Gossypium hirsutum]